MLGGCLHVHGVYSAKLVSFNLTDRWRLLAPTYVCRLLARCWTPRPLHQQPHPQ